MNNNLILYSVGIAVLANLLLPQLLMSLASKDEIKPPNGAENLSLKEQIMHMFVHHAQVPITSSLIIAIIVGLSVYLTQYFKLHHH
tara:strand:+ start:811 stop:1068 length:258 start_codon:yes stop_codon:yes gene_type:complete